MTNTLFPLHALNDNNIVCILQDRNNSFLIFYISTPLQKWTCWQTTQTTTYLLTYTNICKTTACFLPKTFHLHCQKVYTNNPCHKQLQSGQSLKERHTEGGGGGGRDVHTQRKSTHTQRKRVRETQKRDAHTKRKTQREKEWKKKWERDAHAHRERDRQERERVSCKMPKAVSDLIVHSYTTCEDNHNKTYQDNQSETKFNKSQAEVWFTYHNTHHSLSVLKTVGGNEVEWSKRAEIRKAELLSVNAASKATVWPTAGSASSAPRFCSSLAMAATPAPLQSKGTEFHLQNKWFAASDVCIF